MLPAAASFSANPDYDIFALSSPSFYINTRSYSYNSTESSFSNTVCINPLVYSNGFSNDNPNYSENIYGDIKNNDEYFGIFNLEYNNFTQDTVGPVGVSSPNYFESGFELTYELDSSTIQEYYYPYMVYASDFYCWESNDYKKHSEISFECRFSYEYGQSDFTPENVYITYSLSGSSDVYTYYFTEAQIREFNFDDGFFELRPSMFLVNYSDALVYVHDFVIEYNTPIVPFETFYAIGDYQYCYRDDLRVLDIGLDPDVPGNPALPLVGYTNWLGHAVSGFLDLNIFPGFTLGGILMTIIAFSCVIWFLKLFAGG
jgi:hypothetical protein